MSAQPETTSVATSAVDAKVSAQPSESFAPGTRVFVGNLAYKATQDELRQFFAPVGELVNVQLIHRQGRSLGFDFVTFKTEEEAQKAVNTLNQTLLGERVINLEIALVKPEATTARAAAAAEVSAATGRVDEQGNSAQAAGATGRAPRRRNRKPRQTNGEAPAKSQTVNVTVTEVSSAPAPARIDNGESAAEAADGSQQQAARKRKPRNRKPRKTAATEGDKSGAEQVNANANVNVNGNGNAAAEPRPRRERAPRQPREPRELTGTPSPTTLYVGNLPFKVTDEDLRAVFKSFAAVSAYVVVAKNGRSKGFGFLEMASAEDQTRALADIGDIVVDGRTLIVRPAYSLPATNTDNNATATGTAIAEQQQQ